MNLKADKSCEASTVAESLWRHLQCGSCASWFVVEDDKKEQYFCAHCGILNKIPKSEGN
jgi:hypothetical protein